VDGRIGGDESEGGKEEAGIVGDVVVVGVAGGPRVGVVLVVVGASLMAGAAKHGFGEEEWEEGFEFGGGEGEGRGGGDVVKEEGEEREEVTGGVMEGGGGEEEDGVGVGKGAEGAVSFGGGCAKVVCFVDDEEVGGWWEERG
jgi:hypothetical protein